MSETAGRQQDGVKPLVLIVDDEPDIVEILGEQLAKAYRTATASSGPEAIAQFHLERPDVVLLDINMPEMDGVHVQRELHAIDADVPVIMLTSARDVNQLATALKNGAFGYMPKPYDFVYLTHVLAAALSQRRRPR